ncbi:putative RNA pseudouridine synthase [Moraxella macacae 0408225]|uniref:Putative RNA pseudouridine synthase n=1 Tax=Moraxella macacae 0408225 TaxID=1230338 RepID=L2F6H9_9GAMM|nr:pseudouridine synthase [Moraxella macacae]ELA08401.1 putative RNA pseudouridine synthase [Moraxella macacae 0408225]
MKILEKTLLKQGVKPSRVYLSNDKAFLHVNLLDFFAKKFSHIDKTTWQQRFDNALILDENHQPVSANTPYQVGQTLLYYRDVGQEPAIPFKERILAVDEHLIVVDKPHFLPVIPTGRFVKQTLLARLRSHPKLQHLDVMAISPIHRLDKDTAGVMLFSHNPTTRSNYQQLFAKKQMHKVYEAIAPTRLDLVYPYQIASRLVRADRFFLTKTVAGEVNAITNIEHMEVLQGKLAGFSRYRLTPLTGKKHQLRVHMASLGMPLLYDDFYPLVKTQTAPNLTTDFKSTDFKFPLQLLAKQIGFVDPISSQYREFISQQNLPTV